MMTLVLDHGSSGLMLIMLMKGNCVARHGLQVHIITMSKHSSVHFNIFVKELNVSCLFLRGHLFSCVINTCLPSHLKFIMESCSIFLKRMILKTRLFCNFIGSMLS